MNAAVSKWIPGVEMLRTYAREWFRSDLVAGLSVAAVTLFRMMLEHAGVTQKIGSDKLFPTVHAGAKIFEEDELSQALLS